MVELGDISDIRKGKRFEESSDGDYFEILGRSIRDKGNLTESEMKKVKVDGKNRKYILEPYDIVLTVDGTTDKLSLIQEKDKFVCGSTCAMLNFKDQDKAEKVYDYLSSEEGKKVLSQLKKGATIPHINLKDLVNMRIPI